MPNLRRRRNRVAVHAFGFFREPFQERSRVDDFALRFGERFALLGGQDQREVVGVLV
jgi:hypothetical protein